MSFDVFYVLDPGFGAHLQDQGRRGLRRYGVPPGGALDSHAASIANQLLNNPPSAPVLELMLQGASLAALRSVWIAVTGADCSANVPMWRAVHLQSDDVVAFPRNLAGVWTYIAVEGGFEGEPVLGSVGASPRVKLGRSLMRGNILRRSEENSFQLAPGVAGRHAVMSDRRSYLQPPSIRFWPGPQWDWFNSSTQTAFLNRTWTLSSKSDRTGYRLEGVPLKVPSRSMISEPIRVGTIQIPPDGNPIVTLNDGPTVGGYPKLGVVDPEDLAWLVQCRPGQSIRFQLAVAR